MLRSVASLGTRDGNGGNFERGDEGGRRRRNTTKASILGDFIPLDGWILVSQVF